MQGGDKKINKAAIKNNRLYRTCASCAHIQ